MKNLFAPWCFLDFQEMSCNQRIPFWLVLLKLILKTTGNLCQVSEDDNDQQYQIKIQGNQVSLNYPPVTNNTLLLLLYYVKDFSYINIYFSSMAKTLNVLYEIF